MTTKDTCLRDLRLRILSLAIAPGEDLDEARLSKEHGLSRTPLREVLHRLQGEGYVTLAPNRGAKVASMDLSRMRTFFQTAPLVYASVARMAADHATAPEIARLKDTQQAFRAATRAGAPGEAALSNHRFHEIIGQMAQNPYLEAALGRMLIDHTRLSQTFYRPQSAQDAGRVEEAADQHDEMIAAFEAHDGAAAVEVTLRHWDLSRDRLERYVRPDPLPHGLEALRHAV